MAELRYVTPLPRRKRTTLSNSAMKRESCVGTEPQGVGEHIRICACGAWGAGSVLTSAKRRRRCVVYSGCELIPRPFPVLFTTPGLEHAARDGGAPRTTGGGDKNVAAHRWAASLAVLSSHCEAGVRAKLNSAVFSVASGHSTTRCGGAHNRRAGKIGFWGVKPHQIRFFFMKTSGGLVRA